MYCVSNVGTGIATILFVLTFVQITQSLLNKMSVTIHEHEAMFQNRVYSVFTFCGRAWIYFYFRYSQITGRPRLVQGMCLHNNAG